MLGLTIVPSVLVLIVGGELIRSSTERWFARADRRRAAARRRRSPATTTASARRGRGAARRASPRRCRSRRCATRRRRGASGAADRAGGHRRARRRWSRSTACSGRARGRSRWCRSSPCSRPALPRGHVARPRPIALAAPGRRRQHRPADASSRSTAAASWCAPASVVRDRRRAGRSASSSPATTCPGSSRTHARRITEAYEKYNELRVMKRPLEGVYLSLFLMMTLMILVSATWTRALPRQADHAAGAACWPPARARSAPGISTTASSRRRATSSARWSRRSTRWPASSATSQQKLEHSRLDLERKNLELDERRRYIETVLERIATGVVSIDPDGRIEHDQHAPRARLLDVDAADRRLAGRTRSSAATICSRSAADARTPTRGDRRAGGAGDRAGARRPRAAPRRRRDRRCYGTTGALEGTVLVFDDVTPLIRTQRVAAWRDVARRLAHEIKNPLTPIQLCAERMRRHFAHRARRAARELVDECTLDDRRRGRVAEGAGRRVRAVRAHAGAARRARRPERACSTETLALYNGLFREIRLERRFAAGAAARAGRRRADSPRGHQPGRQRGRGARRHAAPARARTATRRRS